MQFSLPRIGPFPASAAYCDPYILLKHWLRAKCRSGLGLKRRSSGVAPDGDALFDDPAQITGLSYGKRTLQMGLPRLFARRGGDTAPRSAKVTDKRNDRDRCTFGSPS